MKNPRYLSVYLATLLVFLLTSCSPANPDNSPNQPSISYPSESSAVLYINQRLSFSVEIPLNWLGQIEISEKYDIPHQDGGHCITVYHKPTHDDNADIGILFMIDCYPGKWTAEESPVMAGSSTVVLQTEENTYLFRTPSDVQWNEENSVLGNSYKELEQQFEFIKEHISAI